MYEASVQHIAKHCIHPYHVSLHQQLHGNDFQNYIELLLDTAASADWADLFIKCLFN
jgi:hypothetical protein